MKIVKRKKEEEERRRTKSENRGNVCDGNGDNGRVGTGFLLYFTEAGGLTLTRNYVKTFAHVRVYNKRG